MENSEQKIAVIAGAGPAGLTAALELLKHTDILPIVCEASNEIGGISKTVEYKGNRMDIGGHRFFSKDDTIMQYWLNLMPIQKNPQDDDDQVMLVRQRISRIFYLRKFFDYPISLKWETFKNMGLRRTTLAALGYLFALIVKRKEKSLEDFYVNRFGKPLYRMFFEDYTEKVWGVHPSRLGADWGSQRVKGLSLSGVMKNVVGKFVSKSVAYLCLRNVNGGGGKIYHL